MMRESQEGFPDVKNHFCYAVTTESLRSEAIELSGVRKKSFRLIDLSLRGSSRVPG
jgi:hypothetical protein